MRGVAFDLRRAYRLSPAATLRPEPFGALAYHFGNRRLSFLKSRRLVSVVRLLSSHDSAAGALAKVCLPDRPPAGPGHSRAVFVPLGRLAAGTVRAVRAAT